MIAQALPQGRAVVFQSAEIQLPGSGACADGADREVEPAAGIHHQSLDGVFTSQRLLHSLPLAESLLRLKAPLGKDRLVLLGVVFRARPFSIDRGVKRQLRRGVPRKLEIKAPLNGLGWSLQDVAEDGLGD